MIEVFLLIMLEINTMQIFNKEIDIRTHTVLGKYSTEENCIKAIEFQEEVYGISDYQIMGCRVVLEEK